MLSMKFSNLSKNTHATLGSLFETMLGILSGHFSTQTVVLLLKMFKTLPKLEMHFFGLLKRNMQKIVVIVHVTKYKNSTTCRHNIPYNFPFYAELSFS